MKNPYRIKHEPTGLYYKPGSINLTKNGKVYITGGSVLTSMADYDYINCCVTNLKYKKMLEDAGLEESSWSRYRIPKSQFIIEEI